MSPTKSLELKYSMTAGSTFSDDRI